jgi:D-glycero-D-manno-heptose 1,7-bisphosphate phosphatase
MLLRAAQALNIDLNRSLMIGDRPSDLQAGAACGCQSALVTTGYGASVTFDETSIDRYLGTYPSVGDAVQAWLRE